MKQKKLIAICGSTASGKTSLALELARKFNGEIIAADSRTIYREMDIGTAKPSFKERLEIPHYLIDLIDPDEEFTVAQFKEKALIAISQVYQHFKNPFLVGGTGLYLSAVIDNLNIPPVPPDKDLRKKMEIEANEYGLDFLWEKLIKIDPQAVDFVQRQNPRRVIRALEVCLKTKKPFSALRKKGDSLFETLKIGIKIDKKETDQRIDQRVDKMIEKGLIDEVKNLIEKYPLPSAVFHTIGYQEIISYFNKECSLEQAIEIIKKNTKHYARRQVTWFKKEKNINWIKDFKQAENLTKNFLKN